MKYLEDYVLCYHINSPELTDGSPEVAILPREENLTGVVLLTVEIELSALQKLIQLMFVFGNLLCIHGVGLGAASKDKTT